MNSKHYALVFFILGILVNVSCKKESTVGAVSSVTDGSVLSFPDPVGPSSKFYFRAELGGSPFLLQDSVNQYINVADSSRNGTCGDSGSLYYREGQRSRFLQPNTPFGSLSITFYDCLNDTDTVAYKDTMLLRAGPTFAFVDASSSERGVEVVWLDPDGREWKTRPGSGFPSNSSFVLTRLDTNLCPDSASVRIAEGRFIGTLFSGNQQLQVSDSDFRIRLVKF